LSRGAAFGSRPPSSGLGQAISYLLNNVVPLRRFLDDGLIPIDNGAVERLHVHTALTRGLHGQDAVQRCVAGAPASQAKGAPRPGPEVGEGVLR
jgi:hypothetical protein